MITVVSDTLTPALRRLKQELADPSRVMRVIEAILMKSFEANLKEQGRPVKWKPLALATTRGWVTKEERRGKENILYPTGKHIKQAVQTRSDRYSAEIGAPGVVPAVHQYGTNRAGRGNLTTIPKRTFIGRSDRPQKATFDLLPEDEKAIERVITDAIDKAAK